MHFPRDVRLLFSSMGVVFGKISEELPRHSVVFKAASYTVRRYEPSVAVQCDYTQGWGRSADGGPFGALARYIGVFSQPENVAKSHGKPEPISMTAPVLIDPSNQHNHTMMFLLPRKYGSVEDAPLPANPNVRLQQLPARLQAVRTFNGNLRPARAREQLDLLLADLKADGWQTKNASDDTAAGVDWVVAGYNAPFVLPYFKTNEVMVGVEERPDVEGEQRSKE